MAAFRVSVLYMVMTYFLDLRNSSSPGKDLGITMVFAFPFLFVYPTFQ